MLGDGIDEVSRQLFDDAICPKLDYLPEEAHVKALSEFFDKVIEEEVLV